MENISNYSIVSIYIELKQNYISNNKENRPFSIYIENVLNMLNTDSYM